MGLLLASDPEMHVRSVPCPGCGAHLPDLRGPTHRYLESSPGCWAAYGDRSAWAAWAPHHRTIARWAADLPESLLRHTTSRAGPRR